MSLAIAQSRLPLLASWAAARVRMAITAVAFALGSLGAFSTVAAESLSPAQLIDAALQAAGHRDPCARASLIERFDALAAEARPEFAPGSSADPELVSRKLLTQLHRQFLIGQYDAATSDIGVTLERGTYNCVSGTILLVALARSLDQEVEVISLKGHVLARLEQHPDHLLETTALPATFGDVGIRSTNSQLPSSTTSAATFSLEKSRQARVLNDSELIAKVYYNKAVVALSTKQFAVALEALEQSRRLDPLDADARENQLATLNNWALALSRDGQYELALAKIHEGLAIDPEYSALLMNELHIIRAWVLKLSSDGDTPKALAILQAGALRRPSETLFKIGIEQLSTP